MGYKSDDLTFDESAHKYCWRGTSVLSVTQAINLAGCIDSTWFTEFSRQRGKAVHIGTHFDDEGTLREDSIDPVIRPYIEAARRFKQETGFSVESIGDIERRICVPSFGYAGTLDRIGIMRSANSAQRALIDYKTGVIPWWCRLQTAAYLRGIPGGESITRFGVQLKNDGTYHMERYDVKDFRRDLNDFLAVLRVAQIRLENKLVAA